ncbi:hypothetical protein D3C86_2078750 [compost metagenome]
MSIEGALEAKSKIQWLNNSTISSSNSIPLYTFSRLRNLSKYSAAQPDFVNVPISPPEPLIHITSELAPVNGSLSVILTEVFPPP